MKKKVLIVLFIIIAFYAKQASAQDSLKHRYPLVYVEFLGNGWGYTLNFESNLAKRLNYRIGLYYLPGNVSGPGITPEIIYFFGKKKNFEIAEGLSLSYRRDTHNNFSFNEDYFFYNTVRIGYRYEKPQSRLIIKFSILSFTTIYQPSSSFCFFPWLGLSAGWRIKKAKTQN